MILLDTSGLLSALFPDQPHHQRSAHILLDLPVPGILSPFVLAEVDYMIGQLAGAEAELQFLDDVAREAYRLVDFSSSDVAEAHDIIARYMDQDIGLADASLVLLSQRMKTLDILTLDERHFRVVRGWKDQPFRILPADHSAQS